MPGADGGRCALNLQAAPCRPGPSQGWARRRVWSPGAPSRQECSRRWCRRRPATSGSTRHRDEPARCCRRQGAACGCSWAQRDARRRPGRPCTGGQRSGVERRRRCSCACEKSPSHVEDSGGNRQRASSNGGRLRRRDRNVLAQRERAERPRRQVGMLALRWLVGEDFLEALPAAVAPTPPAWRDAHGLDGRKLLAGHPAAAGRPPRRTPRMYRACTARRPSGRFWR